MAKQMQDKERFVDMRAEGNSLQRISDEISVSKPILVQWQKDFIEQIEAAKYARLESVVEKYRLLKENRISLFGELLNRTLDEIKKRNLADVPTDKLVTMVLRLTERLQQEIEPVQFRERDQFDFIQTTLKMNLSES